jgi:NADH-quinone oxidoreductase subunit H
MNLTAELVAALIKIVVVVAVMMVSVPMLVWMERKLVADFQARIGPNRVGPFGILQSFADGIKLLCKEDITPSHVDRSLYFLAPVVMMLPALALFAVIPFGSRIDVGGQEVPLVVADIPIGVLYLLAITSLGVYGVVLSGWASNSKYSLLGGLRSSAQMVSYELPMGMAIVAAVLISTRDGQGGLGLQQIVAAQAGGFWRWNAFAMPPLGLIAAALYYVCGIAETNRAPFDLPEAETELVAGYHTEYSSMKFAMFFLAEYANMVNVSAVLTTLFLGGWHGLFPLGLAAEGSLLAALSSVFWFAAKVLVVLVVYMWLRATLPRLRYDQLMRFAWKGLLPVALVNILLIAVVLTLFFGHAAQTAQNPPPTLMSGFPRIARP